MCKGSYPYRPRALPINFDVVNHRVQLLCYPVVLILWEDDSAAVTAFSEGFEDVGDIVFLASSSLDCASLFSLVLTFNNNATERRSNRERKQK